MWEQDLHYLRMGRMNLNRQMASIQSDILNIQTCSRNTRTELGNLGEWWM